MSEAGSKHVFISYVREDADEVDGLCAVLEAAQIPYWRDRTDLGPGDAWRAKIREAIGEGSLVFMACFSDNSRARDRSYMNEEITLAVEEFRRMPPGRTWLIPIRFDAGELPEWDLGAGRMLSDLNFSDLFGKDHMANAARLVTTIHRLMGEKRLNPATALAAVEQAGAAGRADLLKRLTKEMLLEPSRRIELDDLVSQEVQRVLAVLHDQERVSGSLGGSGVEQIVRLVGEAQELWKLVEPFCASLQVASRWGNSQTLVPWATGLRSFVAATTRVSGGVSALIDLRHIPGMVGIMTAALACATSGNWQNLKALIVDQSVQDKYERKPLPIIEATDPYKPFMSSNDWVMHALARASIHDEEVKDALAEFTERRRGKYRTPSEEWLHHILRPVFADQLSDDSAYNDEFDRAEIMLGVLAQDATNMRAAANQDGRTWGRSYWYGRSTWRSAYGHGNPVEYLLHEFETQGALWGPLQGGLFGRDENRARAALEAYKSSFNDVVQRRGF